MMPSLCPRAASTSAADDWCPSHGRRQHKAEGTLTMLERFGRCVDAADQHAHRQNGESSRRRKGIVFIRVGAGVLILSLIAGVAVEARTSFAQSFAFSRWASSLTYEVGQGPSNRINFPRGGPDDKRRGYSDLPVQLAALREHGFAITRQASWSND